MKHAGLDGIDDLFFEHQVFEVGLGDDDSLFSGKAFRFADFKKAFDFLVDHADGLVMPSRMGISDRLERMAYIWVASSLRVTSRSSEVIRHPLFGESI